MHFAIALLKVVCKLDVGYVRNHVPTFQTKTKRVAAFEKTANDVYGFTKIEVKEENRSGGAISLVTS